jgi:predicted nucleic acid-binding protein
VSAPATLYLLDTGPLAAYLLGRRGAVTRLDPWVEARETATSIVSYGAVVEYISGGSDSQRRRRELRRLLREIRPLYLRLSILDGYADLRRRLRPPYGPGLIGDLDTLIAATAIEYDLTLVTMDSDFNRVPGLNVLLVDQLR